MKTVVNFQFKSGDSLKFTFDLNESNVNEVSSSIVRNFEKKIFLLQSKASKYFKKSSVLSHRKFEMSLFIEDKHVKTCFSGIETGNGLLRDGEALNELLLIMLFEGINEQTDSEVAKVS